MHMFEVNYVALFISAAIQWVIGAFWFGIVFRKRWNSLAGVEAPNSGRRIFAVVCSFIASLILCFVLVHIILWAGTPNFLGGAALAIVCWLGFMAPPMFMQHIHEQRPANLFAINAGYWVLAMACSGGLLAVWH